jgi:hypothetical protein
MVCAPLLFVASAIVSPSLNRHEGRLLSSIAGHPDRWYIASLLGFVGLMPAILGLMHMLRERKTAFGHLGGAMALIGFVAVAASAGLTFTMWQMAVSPRWHVRSSPAAALHQNLGLRDNLLVVRIRNPCRRRRLRRVHLALWAH